MKDLRLVILGAGAIGSLFGGLLCRVGEDVTLIGRPAHIRSIRSHGLHIDGVTGRKTIRVKAEVSPSKVGESDIVICTVKAYDTRKAAADAKVLMGRETLFLCLQNGLDVEKEAAQEISMDKIARGITNNGCLRIKPGYIRHTGLGDTVISCPGDNWRTRINELAKTMSSAGLPTTVTDEIDRVVLSKVLVNVGINAIGALTRQKNGDLVKNPLLRDLMRSAIEEALRVVEKLGTKMTDENIIEKTFKIAETTSENKNSMLQDVENGKRTEIDFINGAIVRLGEKMNVSTPMNSTLTTLVKALDQGLEGTSRS